MLRGIKKVGIVGAGTMGRRIAYQCVTKGFDTRLFDISSVAVQQARQQIEAWLEERKLGGRLTKGQSDAALRLLHPAASLDECVAEADLTVETVPEIVALKRAVFSQIDHAAPDGSLIGTNTSSIPGSRLSDAVRCPGRVFNFNFGPIDDLKVEIMPHPGTSSNTLESGLTFVRELGMIPILVPIEILGYACNRVWRAIKREVLFLLAGGHITVEEMDRGWMLDWNTPIGPCGLMDLIGLDVVRDIEMVYYQDSGAERDRPPTFLDEMIKQGQLGVKTGRGFYEYPNPAFEQPGFLQSGSQTQEK